MEDLRTEKEEKVEEEEKEEDVKEEYKVGKEEEAGQEEEVQEEKVKEQEMEEEMKEEDEEDHEIPERTPQAYKELVKTALYTNICAHWNENIFILQPTFFIGLGRENIQQHNIKTVPNSTEWNVMQDNLNISMSVSS